MSLARVLVWAAAVVTAAVAVLSALAPSMPSARLVVAVLGAFVGLPVVFVAVGWLYGLGTRRRRH